LVRRSLGEAGVWVIYGQVPPPSERPKRFLLFSIPNPSSLSFFLFVSQPNHTRCAAATQHCRPIPCFPKLRRRPGPYLDLRLLPHPSRPTALQQTHHGRERAEAAARTGHGEGLAAAPPGFVEGDADHGMLQPWLC
jgi:hypothetical protein